MDERSVRALREVLQRVGTMRRHSRVVRYQFGAGYNSRMNLWFIWNGKARNILATCKFTPEGEETTVVLRYRPRSPYKPILLEHQFHDHTGRPVPRMALPSKNLDRHSDWAMRRIHRWTLQRMREESFLASSPHSGLTAGLTRDEFQALREYRQQYIPQTDEYITPSTVTQSSGTALTERQIRELLQQRLPSFPEGVVGSVYGMEVNEVTQGRSITFPFMGSEDSDV